MHVRHTKCAMPKKNGEMAMEPTGVKYPSYTYRKIVLRGILYHRYGMAIFCASSGRCKTILWIVVHRSTT